MAHFLIPSPKQVAQLRPDPAACTASATCAPCGRNPGKGHRQSQTQIGAQPCAGQREDG